MIRQVCEAGTFAPSGGNRQPWVFVPVDDREKIQWVADQYRPVFQQYIAPAIERKEAAEDGGVSSVLAEWLAMAESERLAAMASKVTGAGLDFVAESVIERLEEDALTSLIASTTDFSAAELAAPTEKTVASESLVGSSGSSVETPPPVQPRLPCALTSPTMLEPS